MGIPKFASWLTKKHPDMVLYGKRIPSSCAGLYVDVNGIIHPCCHSETDPAVAEASLDVKLKRICASVDDLVQQAQPQAILYLAMDGVAPRAKMNQQRARRYMGAAAKYAEHGVGEGGGLDAPDPEKTVEEFKEAEAEAEAELAAVKATLDMGLYGDKKPSAVGATEESGMGKAELSEDSAFMRFDSDGSALQSAVETPSKPPQKSKADDDDDEIETSNAKSAPASIPRPVAFDSACISPGTEFMVAVAKALRDHCLKSIGKRSGWPATLAVAVSDSNAPGEGEHKIVDFIRAHNGKPTWPNGAHVIVGLDADLVLLSMSLHVDDMYLMRDNDRTKAVNAVPGDGGEVDPTAEGDDDDDDAEDTAEETEAGEATDSTPAATPVVDVDLKKPKLGGKKGKLGGKKHEGSRSPAASPSPAPTPQAVALGAPVEKKGGRHGRRRGFFGRSRLEYYDINACGDGIVSEVASLTSNLPGAAGSAALARVQLQPYRVIEDFICLASMMGNDFMPRLPTAFCGEAAMDDFIEVYVRYVLPHCFLTMGAELYLPGLRRFMHGYAGVEAVNFRQYLIKAEKITPEEAACPVGSDVDEVWAKAYMASTTVADCEKLAPVKGKGSEKLKVAMEKAPSADACAVSFGEDSEMGKQALGRPIGTSTSRASLAACAKFVEGMRFVWRYYATSSLECSWRWFYPAHHSPLARDLLVYLSAIPEDLPAPEVDTKAPAPFVQLLCILPPTSSPLLPRPLREVMLNSWADGKNAERAGTADDRTQKLKDTFAREWSVDFAGSSGKEHLAAVLIPFADAGVLIDVVEKTAQKKLFTDDETFRNTNCDTNDLYVCIEHPAMLKGGMHSKATVGTLVGIAGVSCSFQERPASPTTAVSSGLVSPSGPTAAAAPAAPEVPEQQREDTLEFLGEDDKPATDDQDVETKTDEAPVVEDETKHEEPKKQADVKKESAEYFPGSGLPAPILRFTFDPAPARKRKARRYRLDVPVRGLPSAPPPPVGDKPQKLRKRFPPHPRGVTLGDFLLGVTAVAAVACACAAFFSRRGRCPYAKISDESAAEVSLISSIIDTALAPMWMVLSLFSMSTIYRLTAVVKAACLPLFFGLGGFLWLVAAGVVDAAPSGSNLRRNLVRDIFADWLCPKCTSRNFGKNEQCFQCGAPFSHAECHAIFSSAIPSQPPAMDPDHRKYGERVTLTVPQSIRDAALC